MYDFLLRAPYLLSYHFLYVWYFWYMRPLIYLTIWPLPYLSYAILSSGLNLFIHSSFYFPVFHSCKASLIFSLLLNTKKSGKTYSLDSGRQRLHGNLIRFKCVKEKIQASRQTVSEVVKKVELSTDFTTASLIFSRNGKRPRKIKEEETSYAPNIGRKDGKYYYHLVQLIVSKSVYDSCVVRTLKGFLFRGNTSRRIPHSTACLHWMQNGTLKTHKNILNVPVEFFIVPKIARRS